MFIAEWFRAAHNLFMILVVAALLGIALVLSLPVVEELLLKLFE